MPSKSAATPKKTAAKAPKASAVEPPKVSSTNCSGCNHPETFHRSGTCKVMSCKCKGWNGRRGAVKGRSKR